jgi:ankyrin repeat protein
MNRRAIFLFTFIILLSGFQAELAFSASSKDAFEACDHGDIVALKKILGPASSFDTRGKDGETPLIRCASAGQIAGVRYLLGKKADVNLVNNSGRSALSYAIANHQDQVANLLIEKGADVGVRSGEKKENLLFEAIRGGNLEILPQIIKMKPNLVNDKNSDGETALFETVRSEQSAAAAILLKNGGDREVTNNKGQRAIDLVDPKTDTKLISVLKSK